MNSQKKNIRIQKNLKERFKQEENFKNLKRIEDKTPFFSAKQLDFEFMQEHNYLVKNMKKVKNISEVYNLSKYTSKGKLPSILRYKVIFLILF